MAKKDSNELDDFDFDDMGDMDDLDMMMDPSKDTREPITKVKDGFKNAVKDSISSPSYIKKLMRKALPEEYESAFDALDKIEDGVSKLYNKSADALEPTLKELRKKTKKLGDKADKFLPKRMADALKEWADQDPDYQAMTEEQQRQSEMDLQMANVFKTQAVIQNVQYKETTRRHIATQALDLKKHGQSMLVLDKINRGIRRLVGYQDNVTAKYQQKSLELQYRSLFLQHDALKAFKVESARQIQRLDAIVNNTGLPDAIKLTKADAFKTRMRDKFIDKVQGKAFRGINEVVDRVMNNAGNVIDGKIQDLNNVLREAMGVHDMFDSGMGMDPYQLAGEMGGSLLMDGVSDSVGGAARRHLDKNKKVKGFGLAMARQLANVQGTANRWSRSSTDVDYSSFWSRTKGGVIQGLKDMLHGGNGLSLNTKDASESMEDASTFTRHNSKALSEIIPGFLSRILREVTVLSTGDKNTPFVNYNISRGRFTTYSVKKDDITKRLIRSKGHDTISNDLKYLTKHIDKDNKLSDSAQKAFRRQMIINNKDGHSSDGFDVSRLSSANNYDTSISKEDREELAKFFTEAYRAGNFGKVEENHDLRERVLQATNRFNDVGRNIPEVINELELQLKLGNLDVLEELGLMKENPDGKLVLDHDALVTFLLSEDDASQTSGGGPQTNRSTFRFAGRNRRGYNRADFLGGAKRNRQSGIRDSLITTLSNAIDTLSDETKRDRAVRSVKVKSKKTYRNVRNIVTNTDARKQFVNNTRNSINNSATNIVNNVTNTTNNFITQHLDDDARYQLWLAKHAVQEKYGQSVDISREFIDNVRAKAAEFAREHGLDETLKNQQELIRYHSWFLQRELEDNFNITIPTTAEASKAVKKVLSDVRRSTNDTVQSLKTSDGRKLLANKAKVRGRLVKRQGKRLLRRAQATTLDDVKQNVSSKIDNVKAKVDSFIGDNETIQSFRIKAETFIRENGLDKVIKTEAEREDVIAHIIASEIMENTDPLARGNKQRSRVSKKRKKAQLALESRRNAKSIVSDKISAIADIAPTDPKYKFAGKTTVNIVRDKNGNSWQKVESGNSGGNINSAINALSDSPNDTTADSNTTSGEDYTKSNIYRPAVIDRLDKILLEIKASTEILKAGLIVQTEKDADGKSKRYGFRYGLRGGAGKLLSGMGSFAKNTLTSYGKMVKAWGNFASNSIRGAGNIALGAGRALGTTLGFGPVKDIYVAGEDTPRLLARLLKKGHYLDKPTGKVIKRLKDLDDCKGPIVDLEGNEVINVKDVARGCFTKDGEPILKKWTRRAFDMYSAIAFTPLTAGAKFLKWGGSKLINALSKPQDVYVKGDHAPRMLSSIMSNGGYFSARTGKVIRSPNDIDGEVKDREGNVVISLADLAPPKGIVNKHGKPFTTLSEKLANGAIKLIKGIGKATWATMKLGFKIGMLPVKIGNAILKKGWKMTKWGSSMSEADKLKVQVETEMLTTLQNIYSLLDKRLPKKKSILGDTDGDGIRENSVEDIRRRRRSRVKPAPAVAANKTKEKAQEAKEDGFLSKIGNLIMMIPGMGSIAGAASKAGAWLATKGKAVGSLALKAGKWLVPRAMAMGGTALTTLRAGALATSIATGAGWATGGVLGAAAAFFGSPLILGALAVAAVAGVGYLGYKWYKNRNKSLFKQLRMHYYGLKKDSKDADKVAWLEDKLQDRITYSGDSASIKADEKLVSEVLDKFDIKANDEPKMQVFMNWFDSRFKPVYLDNCAALQSILPGSKLDDMDTKLTKEQKRQILSKVKRNVGSDPIFNVVDSPFSDPLYTDSKAIEELLKEIDKDAGGDKATPKDKFATSIGAAGAVATLYDKDGKPINPNGKSNVTKVDFSKAATGALSASAISKSMTDKVAEVQKVSSTLGKSIKRKDLTPLDCVRFKTYGLVEMDKDKVKTLQELEHFLKDDITYGKDNVATYDKSAESVLEQMSGAFGIAPTSSSDRYNWIQWFSNRFIPVFLNYCSAVKSEANVTDLDNVNTALKPNQLINVANLIVATKVGTWIFKFSVWTQFYSPWPGYRLNNDSSSTKPNISLMEQKTKSNTLQDMRDFSNSSLFATTMGPNKQEASSGSGVLSNLFKQTGGGGISGSPMVSDNPKLINTNTNDPVKVDTTPELLKRTITEGSKTSEYGNKSYIMPTTGSISSKFGMRKDPVYGTQKMHSGIDIRAPAGTPIKATADGVIIRREFAGAYGNLIIIKHNDGKSSRYGHMLRFQEGLGLGSNVKQGDIIGYVGSTGKSTGNHLHFEIRDGADSTAKAIDPISVLDKSTAAEPLKELADKETVAKKGYPDVDLSMEGKDTIASTITKVATPSPSVNPVASAPNTGLGDASTTAIDNTNKAKAAETINNANVNERNKMVNQDNAASLSSTLEVLRSSYKVQLSMDQKLSAIKDLLALRPNGGESTGSENTSDKPQARSGNRPSTSNVVNNPVSVKKTQY